MSPYLRCDGDPNELASAATQRFARRYGYWRPVIAEMVEKYLAMSVP